VLPLARAMSGSSRRQGVLARSIALADDGPECAFRDDSCVMISEAGSGLAQEGSLPEGAVLVPHAEQPEPSSTTFPATVAGMDISFVKDTTTAYVCLAVLDFPSMTPVGFAIQQVEMTAPYVAGFLAFREVDLMVPLLRAWSEVSLPAGGPGKLPLSHGEVEFHLCGEWRRRKGPLPSPDVVLVDGNGYLHPRRCGSASVLGVVADVRTIGVGKQLHSFGALNRDDVVTRTERVLSKRGEWVPLHAPRLASEDASEWEVVGAALQSASTAHRPMYVSVGHRVSLETACNIVCRCLVHRIPEPIRQADLFSRDWIRETFGH
jgi:endonuclease V